MTCTSFFLNPQLTGPIIATYQVNSKSDPQWTPMLGTNFPMTLPIFMVVTSEVSSLVFQSSNGTSQDENGSYQVQTGSAIGFSEQLEVALEGGVNVPFVAEGKVTITGTLGATQDFSWQTTTQLDFVIPAEQTVAVFEGIIYVSYYIVQMASAAVDAPPFNGACIPIAFTKYKDDVIKSGITKTIQSGNSSTAAR